MKRKSLIVLGLLTAMCIVLFAFTPGGNSYTIYLNQKLIAKEYLARHDATPQISLADAKATDEYQVYFSQCGEIGKSRTLSLRGANNKVLKEWQYMDTTDDHTPMSFKASDVLAINHADAKNLKLVYASKEITEGVVLANFVFNKATAKN